MHKLAELFTSFFVGALGGLISGALLYAVYVKGADARHPIPPYKKFSTERMRG